MESNNLEVTPAQYAQLLDAFINQNQLTEAVQIYEEVKSKDPGFILDKVKAVKMANLFLQNDNIEGEKYVLYRVSLGYIIFKQYSTQKSLILTFSYTAFQCLRYLNTFLFLLYHIYVV